MKGTFTFVAATLASSLIVLAGCDQTSNNMPADRAATESGAPTTMEPTIGERIDEASREAGQAIDDSQITATIKSKYVADDTLKALDISVDTEHGTVTLTGEVQNDSAKTLAEQIARGVEGVVNVNNQLTVRS
ncbi:MAG TPA: BON domain-containing protein [Thiobacillaceae bacterium]|nr:BON domain-containing protein [Thiobacillaceae bacterium]